MVYAQPSISPGKWVTQTVMGFCDTNGSPYLSQTTRPYYNQQKKKKKITCWFVDFAVPADHRLKLKEGEKKDIKLELARELKKSVEHENDDCNNYNWCSWYNHKRIGTGTGGLGNNRTSGDLPKYCIIEIDQNTEKSHGNSTRLTAT